MDRRKLLRALGLGGLFGVPAVASAAPSPAPIKSGGGVIVFHIGVGALPPFKAEAMIARIKEKMGPDPEGWQRYFLPVRPPQESKVEVFFNDHHKGEAEKIVQEIVAAHFLPNKDDAYWEKLEKETKNYVLLMLGAPVIKIELDESQLQLCWKKACGWMDELLLETQKCSVYHVGGPPEDLIKDLTLGYATVILGRIRSMYQSPPGGPVALDGNQLVQDGKTRIKEAKWWANFRYGRKSENE